VKAIIRIKEEDYSIDFSRSIDLSIPLQAGHRNPLAWYQKHPVMEPVKMGNWIGKVSEGGSVNFINIFFNPHAHGTHTESYGHISKEFYSVNEALDSYFFIAELITVSPEKSGEDQVITKEIIEKALGDKQPQALIIRTLPNDEDKKSKIWSDTNWPFLEEKAAEFIREKEIEHLLIDLPSVDKERDEGKLSAHKAFWNFPEDPRKSATITEMIFVPNEVKDGKFLLNLQMAAFENDAAPSRPLIFEIKKA